MWTLGLSIYTTTLAIVTIKLAIITPRFTLYHIISFILSLLVFIATIYFNSISPKLTIEWLNIKAQAAFMFASPNLWLFMALAPIVACLPDTTFQVFFNRKSPKDFHIMQEMEHGWQNNVYVSRHQGYIDPIPNFVNELTLEEDEVVYIENSQDGSNIENDEVPLPMSDDLLEKQKWEEDTKNDQLEIVDLNDPLSNMNNDIDNSMLNSKEGGYGQFNRTRKFLM